MQEQARTRRVRACTVVLLAASAALGQAINSASLIVDTVVCAGSPVTVEFRTAAGTRTSDGGMVSMYATGARQRSCVWHAGTGLTFYHALTLHGAGQSSAACRLWNGPFQPAKPPGSSSSKLPRSGR